MTLDDLREQLAALGLDAADVDEIAEQIEHAADLAEAAVRALLDVDTERTLN